ncbi:hypothetical protein VTL71DRAFT_9152 [Oculimacula yallundae]|uniref:Uncharacterized protein n=1 Tax=Oculimacula yallundae TaxID=86028 RepID=A0ABR4BTX7_9HELO
MAFACLPASSNTNHYFSNNHVWQGTFLVTDTTDPSARLIRARLPTSEVAILPARAASKAQRLLFTFFEGNTHYSLGQRRVRYSQYLVASVGKQSPLFNPTLTHRTKGRTILSV